MPTLKTSTYLQNLLSKLTKHFTSIYRRYPAFVKHVKYQVTSSCDIYVLTALILFIIIQSLFWPIYVTLYLFMLLVNGYRIYNYKHQLNETEVASIEQFREFEYVWLEFIYNITYRRAHVNSFSMLYRVLKLLKGNTCNHKNIFNKWLVYLKTLFYTLFLLLWNLITGTPWLIVSRSFQYSKAFRFLEGSSPFDPLLMSGLVINNYQMSELLPGLNYRIYKAKGSVWNFNP